MDTNNNNVTISLDEYRDLLAHAANYQMLKDVIKAGVRMSYSSLNDLTLDQTAIDVVLKYILGSAYEPTVKALISKED